MYHLGTDPHDGFRIRPSMLPAGTLRVLRSSRPADGRRRPNPHASNESVWTWVGEYSAAAGFPVLTVTSGFLN